MRGAQDLQNIDQFIGGYNLFRTKRRYLLNKGEKAPFRKIVILEKITTLRNEFYYGQQNEKARDCSKYLSFYWWTQFVSDEKDIFAKKKVEKTPFRKIVIRLRLLHTLRKISHFSLLLPNTLSMLS